MEQGIDRWLLQAAIAGIRIGSWFAFAPFFSNQAVPPRVKAGLTIAVAATLYPVLPLVAPPESVWELGALVLHETFTGLAMGLAAGLIFDGVQLAGQIVGFQIGYSLANIIDPHTQVDTPVMSVLHQVFAMMLFLYFNVHHWILRGLATSFHLISPGASLASADTAGEMVRLMGGIWVIGVEMAAPVLLVTVVADVALGLIGKQTPQLPVLFEGLSLKSVAAFLLLIAVAASWPGYLEKKFYGAVVSMEQLMEMAK